MNLRSPDNGLRQSVQLALNLALLMGVAPFVVFLFSALAPLLLVEFDVTVSKLGWLAAAGFAAAAVASPHAGALIGRVGAATAGQIVAVLTLLSCIAAALSPSYSWLFVPAVLSGLAQAITNPVTNHVVAQRLRGSAAQGVTLGVKQSGVQLGQLTIGLLAPLVAVRYGWRAATLIGAAMAIVAIGTWRYPSAKHPVGEVEPQGSDTSWTYVAARRLIAFVFLVSMAVQVFNLYLPLFAFGHMGWSAKAAGSLLAGVGVAGLISRVGWGYVGGRSRNLSALMRALSLSAALGGLIVAMAAVSRRDVLLWAGVLLVGLSAPALNVLMHLDVVRVWGEATTARVSGATTFAQHAGFAIGPVVYSLVAGQGSGFTMAWLFVSAWFVVCLALVLPKRSLSAIDEKASPKGVAT